CYSGTSRDYFDSRGCVTCHINRWGYRGRDFTIEKSAEVYRIVFLGDSFTFGEGTPEPFLFTTVLSRTLDDRHIGGRRIEVINLGIAGQDGAEELTTYAEFGRKLAADLVILQWNTNDVPLSDIQQDHFRLIGRRYRELFGNNPYRWSRLLTMFYFNMRLQTISRQIITITNEQAEKGRDTFNSIGLLRSVVEADGAEFTVLDFPEIIRFNDYPYVTIVDLLKQYCQSHQIPLVDLLPALSTHRD